MDDTGTVCGGYEISDDDPERTLGGEVSEIGKQRFVAEADEIGDGHVLHIGDLRLALLEDRLEACPRQNKLSAVRRGDAHAHVSGQENTEDENIA